ncbi:PadR family transcriptional regulator [Streptomyces sp. NPDC003753]|uniref:PadR family transcriptional regulator n=1 Tax=unclassified Streptomyces TaxID=2593676 RepID=UPI001908962A|nr:PadR family transcriptional regulator [Streptomyces sp. Y2F8-2]GHK04174.1 PadR family transcriptional regulator [Streptomyces sp. Y2F8-2]
MTVRRRPVSNLLGLAVLGLLLEQPMHPYEMAATLRERNKDTSFKVKNGSLYDVVESLVRAGWIAEHSVERAGRRPERTVYAHTELGREEFMSWLDELVRTPVKEYPSFLAAVSYLGALGPERAVQALQERIARLDEEIDEARRAQAEALSGQTPRLFVIELEYALTMAEAERDWSRQIVGEIQNGTLTWPELTTKEGRQVWTDQDENEGQHA